MLKMKRRKRKQRDSRLCFPFFVEKEPFYFREYKRATRFHVSETNRQFDKLMPRSVSPLGIRSSVGIDNNYRSVNFGTRSEDIDLITLRCCRCEGMEIYVLSAQNGECFCVV